MSSLLTETKRICRDNDIRPKRSKGQNFLIKEDIYGRILDALEIEESDRLVEVGPGPGFLTRKLARRCGEVTAFEIDDKLFFYLKNELEREGYGNVRLVREDIRKVDFCGYYQNGSYKIAANLPYNISSFFLKKVFTSGCRPRLMVLMLQREVAERVTANPPDMSLLSLSSQYFSHPEIIRRVPARFFYPAPKVDSAIVRFTLKDEFPFNKKDEDLFFDMLRSGFSSRRKMLKNNLGKRLGLESEEIKGIMEGNGLGGKARPQELAISDWQALFKQLRDFMI